MEEFERGISRSSMTGEWSDDSSFVLEILVVQLLGTLAMKMSRISGRRFCVMCRPIGGVRGW